MDYIQLFESLKLRTSMYLDSGSYAEASAFVQGCDAGNDYGLLYGFREWLIVRLNGYNNLHWSALVLHSAFPTETVTSEDIISSKERNKIAVNELCDLLIEFLREREKYDGILKIFERYFSWLYQQSWYTPEEHESVKKLLHQAQKKRARVSSAPRSGQKQRTAKSPK